MNIELIAQICHETNAAYCRTIGDNSQKSWHEAEEWQRESARKGVIYALENPDAGANEQHQAWLKDKLADGWVYGPIKDAENKIHPCCLPYHQLPRIQHIKDYLFKGIIAAFVCEQRQADLANVATASKQN